MQDEVIDLHQFGTLHRTEMLRTNRTGCALNALVQLCAETPCHLAHHPVAEHLSPELRALLDQTATPGREIFFSKGADGALFSKPIPHMPDQHRLIAGMFGPALYDTAQMHQPVQIFCIADKPGTVSSPFHLRVDDSAEHQLHEISRHSILKHVLDQVQAVAPLEASGEPRPIYQSKTIGTFSARLLMGPQVHELKCAFLNMVAKAALSGEGVYNKTIRLHPDLSEMLMLKNPTGEILCERCLDGLIGYRIRKSTGKRTFLFVANADDFHDSEPSEKKSTKMQVFKVDYHPDGQRIVLVDHEHEREDEPHSVCIDWTVQRILNAVRGSFTAGNLEDHGCGMFPMYCAALQSRVRGG